MTAPELIELGFQPQTLKYVYPQLRRMSESGTSSKKMAQALKRVADHPHNFVKDEHFGELAQAMLSAKPSVVFQERH